MGIKKNNLISLVSKKPTEKQKKTPWKSSWIRDANHVSTIKNRKDGFTERSASKF